VGEVSAKIVQESEAVSKASRCRLYNFLRARGLPTLQFVECTGKRELLWSLFHIVMQVPTVPMSVAEGCVPVGHQGSCPTDSEQAVADQHAAIVPGVPVFRAAHHTRSHHKSNPAGLAVHVRIIAQPQSASCSEKIPGVYPQQLLI